MPQIFSPRANLRIRLGLALAVGGVAGASVLAWFLARSDQAWGVGRPATQPIPFSHALHVGALGTDCRYCHAGVERAAGAGAAVVAPLRDSLALGQPIA
jgi:hypothetical protein